MIVACPVVPKLDQNLLIVFQMVSMHVLLFSKIITPLFYVQLVWQIAQTTFSYWKAWQAKEKF